MGRLKTMPSRIGTLAPKLAALPKLVDDFYASPEWRAFAKLIKLKRGNRCEDCGSTYRVIADHVVERKDGGADFDEDNIRLRCLPCHNSKTAAARGQRSRGEAGR